MGFTPRARVFYQDVPTGDKKFIRRVLYTRKGKDAKGKKEKGKVWMQIELPANKPHLMDELTGVIEGWFLKYGIWTVPSERENE